MSKKRLQGLLTMLVVAGLVATLPGCAPTDPQEQVASLRARYSARINGFYVEAEPVMEEVEEAVAEAAGEPQEGGEAQELEGEESAPELRQDALLDIIVQHDSATKLDGITLDVVMVDAAEQQKQRWLHWVDTSGLEKANQMQLTYVLEDVPYEEGDGFSAEVRVPVPEAERGDYREFAPGG